MVRKNDEIKVHQMPFGRGVLKDQRANNPPRYHFLVREQPTRTGQLGRLNLLWKIMEA